MRIAVVSESGEDLQRRRRHALTTVTVPEDELRRRVYDHSASPDEREAWSVVEEVDFLLDGQRR